ncbi:T6SS phospholipase effector Tle1-like catalytic domain-containing protein [Pararhodospirillum photometricum]|uniref:T6SS Phospholipase effector Tle1-like catalytic domain-containing protein n=1 Tax=Pararhodospirillum photometricum DSM 122 TaxID=1150469 RepID=H6SS50_PARPM|nr:DUF2235 domain-containing protein [Pararhodospirillum photometricum]CCG07729.1 Putative uncharacterized protein [Pararhodospirillum photometricum DSM 122]
MAHLIVCCDGLWHRAGGNGDPSPTTNVTRLYQALADTTAQGEPQRRVLIAGPGRPPRGRPWGAPTDLLGPSVLAGLSWLGETFQPGDRIFLVGLSQGATIARTLAALIVRYGLPTARHLETGPTLLAAYRARTPLPEGCPPPYPADIHFLGVWETLGPLGIPLDSALWGIGAFPTRETFADDRLSDRVRHACQAFALDETRSPPAPWSNVAARRTVSQLWFPGTHEDVGGALGQTSLSNAALAWMMEQAAACGLALRGDPRPVEGGPLPIRASQNGAPRAVPCFADPQAPLHPLARARHTAPPDPTTPYWPTRILAAGETQRVEVDAACPWTPTGLWLEAGRLYRVEATGRWHLGLLTCGPGGISDNGSHTVTPGQLVSHALATLGRVWHHHMGQSLPPLPGTRRAPTLPWGSLVGHIPGDDGGETLALGATGMVEPRTAGYLYVFANTARGLSGPRSGSLTLDITAL